MFDDMCDGKSNYRQCFLSVLTNKRKCFCTGNIIQLYIHLVMRQNSNPMETTSNIQYTEQKITFYCSCIYSLDVFCICSNINLKKTLSFKELLNIVFTGT